MSEATVLAVLVDPGPNDRQVFASDALNELAESIKAHGLAQPPIVRPMPDGRYQIVAGERRFRAMARVLGWERVPVVIRELDDDAASALMLAENVARADLSPIEEAVAYRRRMDERGLSASTLASEAGVSAARVSSRLRLLSLVAEAQHLLSVGDMSPEVGATLAGLDANRQRIAMRAWAEQRLGVHEMRPLCRRLRSEQDQETAFDVDDFFQIEEYVADARGRSQKTGNLRGLLRECLAELERASLAPHLVARVRAVTEVVAA